MKTILIIMLAVLLSSCTIYKVKSIAPDGKTVDVKVYSSREFQQPNLHYEREGNDAVFDFGAESVTTYDPYSAILQGILSGAITVNPGVPQ